MILVFPLCSRFPAAPLKQRPSLCDLELEIGTSCRSVGVYDLCVHLRKKIDNFQCFFLNMFSFLQAPPRNTNALWARGLEAGWPTSRLTSRLVSNIKSRNCKVPPCGLPLIQPTFICPHWQVRCQNGETLQFHLVWQTQTQRPRDGCEIFFIAVDQDVWRSGSNSRRPPHLPSGVCIAVSQFVDWLSLSNQMQIQIIIWWWDEQACQHILSMGMVRLVTMVTPG